MGYFRIQFGNTRAKLVYIKAGGGLQPGRRIKIKIDLNRD